MRLLILLILLGIIGNETLKKNNRTFIVTKLHNGYRGAFIPPIGTFISKEHANNDLVIAHENCHHKQYQSLGLFGFVLKYFTQLIEDGYDDMNLESECRINESQFCKDNYSICYPKTSFI